MQIGISSKDLYLSEPCLRCGGKKRVSKTWKERVPTLTGSVLVEYSQVICINKVCQGMFDKSLVEEKRKRDLLKEKREKEILLKKSIEPVKTKKTKKSKSRI